MPILFEMNGKMGAVSAQLGAIQIQLATDKAEHKTVHDDLNKKLNTLQNEVDLNTKHREAQSASVKTLRMSYTVLAAIVTAIVAMWSMFGPILRHALGIPLT